MYLQAEALGKEKIQICLCSGFLTTSATKITQRISGGQEASRPRRALTCGGSPVEMAVRRTINEKLRFFNTYNKKSFLLVNMKILHSVFTQEKRINKYNRPSRSPS